MSAHPCAVETCTAPAKTGQLMCLPCWKATPRDLQRAVNATWRNIRKDSAAYREARDAAIAWHRGRASSNAQGGLFG
jgi:hypothetical protein